MGAITTMEKQPYVAVAPCFYAVASLNAFNDFFMRQRRDNTNAKKLARWALRLEREVSTTLECKTAARSKARKIALHLLRFLALVEICLEKFHGGVMTADENQDMVVQSCTRWPRFTHQRVRVVEIVPS